MYSSQYIAKLCFESAYKVVLGKSYVDGIWWKQCDAITCQNIYFKTFKAACDYWLYIAALMELNNFSELNRDLKRRRDNKITWESFHVSLKEKLTNITANSRVALDTLRELQLPIIIEMIKLSDAINEDDQNYGIPGNTLEKLISCIRDCKYNVKKGEISFLKELSEKLQPILKADSFVSDREGEVNLDTESQSSSLLLNQSFPDLYAFIHDLRQGQCGYNKGTCFFHPLSDVFDTFYFIIQPNHFLPDEAYLHLYVMHALERLRSESEYNRRLATLSVDECRGVGGR